MPIDPNFQEKRRIVDTPNNHNVWGPVESTKKLGIHGTNVAVDWDSCSRDGICAEICPVSLYEMVDTPGHPTSDKKSDPASDPAREQDCIQCLACESNSPTAAIKITTM